ncbi:MAG TPA: type II secretion system protein N [Gammaproteobacteria bacterium]|nr:type II secretion system protein N [Gammaproteobacteria bacterium]
MKRGLKWLLLGLASYLVILIATLPIRPVYSLFAASLAPLNLQGVQGKLWNGRATRVYYNKLSIGSISWTYRPTDLLSGHIGFDFINQDHLTRTSGTAGISLLGQPYLENVDGYAPASNLYKMLGSYPLSLSGKMQYTLNQLRLNNNQIGLIQGSMTWRNAAIQAPFQARLGTLELQLSSEQGNILIQISNKGGQLGLEGSIIIQADKRIQTDLRITPRKNANPGLINVLRSFGKSDRSGHITIKFNGYI